MLRIFRAELRIRIFAGLGYDIPVRPRRSNDPTCGNCGYCVRGISGLTCPECGADLREVGITTPHTPHSLSPLVKTLLWTIAIPVPAILISWLLLATILPYSQTRKFNRAIVCQSLSLTTTLDAWGIQHLAPPVIMRRLPPNPDQIVLMDQRGAFLEANLKTGEYSYQTHLTFVQRQSGFNSAVIDNWLSSSGVNAANPDIRKICDGIYAALTEISQGAAGGSSPLVDSHGNPAGMAKPISFWYVHDEPNPIVMTALGVFWAGVWICGLHRIFRRRIIQS